MRIKKYRKSISILLVTTSILVVSGCSNMVLMNPKGIIGSEERTLIITAITLMLFVVVPVIFMALNFSWKYRSSNKDARYRPEWAHSNQIETVVWIIPIIIIAILGTITWKTTHILDPFRPVVSDKKAITIEVISLDWKWLFIYPEQRVATINELAFPKDVPVEFKVTSNSVMNSFFIPQLGGQIYAMPGMQTKLHLIGNEVGKYIGISSGYSGRGFSNMKFTAIVTPTQDAFDQWIANVKRSPNSLNTTSDFNVLAEPSENNAVVYFSNVKSILFKETISKFIGDTNMYNRTNAHSGVKVD